MGATLLLTYTPRGDVELEDYHDWLRQVDNPFFNSRPSVRRYVNYRIRDDVQGARTFTHFDILEMEDGCSAIDVLEDPEIARFARDWVRQWGAVPDPDLADQSVNYQVFACDTVAAPQLREAGGKD